MRVKSPLLRRVFRHVKNMFKSASDFKYKPKPIWTRKKCKSCKYYCNCCSVNPLSPACEQYVKR